MSSLHRGLIALMILLFPYTVDSGSYRHYLLTRHVVARTVVRLVSIDVLKKQAELNDSIELLTIMQYKQTKGETK
jgi:hypothetical protein